jgi:hypothetical protein
MSHDVLPYETPPHFREPLGRAIFGVIVRTSGLLVALYGFYSLVYALGYALEVVTSTRYSGGFAFALFGAVFFAVGVALIKGEWLVRFAYDRKPAPPTQPPVVSGE